MHLFFSLEAQDARLANILWDIKCQLHFVTDEEAGLEENDNYGKEFRSIAIIPTCVSNEFWKALGWKERRLIWRKKREADIRLRINYERFIKESTENKRLMVVDIIVKSIKVVQEKSKEDFRGNELIGDILETLNVSQSQLDQLNME